MKPKSNRELAERIANDLFRNGSNQLAERLVLTIDGPPKRDLGGWSEKALADQIERLLDAEVPRVTRDPTTVKYR